MHNKLNDILLLVDAGDYNKAAAECRKLIRKQGNSAENLSFMADILHQQGKLESALKYYNNALAYADNDTSRAILNNNLGFCYNRSGQYAEAIKAYQRVLQLNQHMALSAFNLATLLLQADQKDEAIACFSKVFASHQVEQKTHYQLEQKSYAALSRIAQFDWSEKDLDRINQLLGDDSLTTADGKAHCCFALANIHDKQGKYQQALAYYKQGNSIRQQMNLYHFGKDEEYIDSVINYFDQQLIDSCQLAVAESKRSKPVFILGMPRSGSTLVEYILSTSDQVTALGELPDMSSAFLSIQDSYPEMAPVIDNMQKFSAAHARHIREAYLEKNLQHNISTPFFTDKMPENFAYLGFILLAFPDAKIIHTVRNPMAVLWSCFQTDFGSNHGFSNSLELLLDYYRGYERIMRHWKQLFAHRIYDLHYEDLVTNSDEQTQKLMEFCGLPANADNVNKPASAYLIKTASLHQVREPVNNSAVEKWKNYAEFLRPVEQAIANMEF